jgi:hypothetical protein
MAAGFDFGGVIPTGVYFLMYAGFYFYELLLQLVCYMVPSYSYFMYIVD